MTIKLQLSYNAIIQAIDL